jgi:hypothetical protein
MRLRLSFGYLRLRLYGRVGFVLPIDAIDPKAQTGFARTELGSFCQIEITSIKGVDTTPTLTFLNHQGNDVDSRQEYRSSENSDGFDDHRG